MIWQDIAEHSNAIVVVQASQEPRALRQDISCIYIYTHGIYIIRRLASPASGLDQGAAELSTFMQRKMEWPHCNATKKR